MMDILITSASRPECLQSEVDSLKYLNCDEGFNLHLHEDVVPGREELSDELVQWAEESNEFTTIYVSNPRIGRGFALNKLRPHAQSDFILYLEEDWEFIKRIDLNYLLFIARKHSDINQIGFYDRELYYIEKPGGPEGRDIFEYKVVQFGSCNLFVSERWNWLPAIWRTEWVKKRWNFKEYMANKEFNRSLKRNVGMNEWNPSWLKKNIGAYIYSDSDECIVPYVKHTSWSIKNDRIYL